MWRDIYCDVILQTDASAPPTVIDIQLFTPCSFAL